MARAEADLNPVQTLWESSWAAALAVWSRFTRLSPPKWCFTREEEKKAHLNDAFAMIRLEDVAVVISLRKVQQLKLESFAVEILAHEIGHHMYAPADLTDYARLMVRTRSGLPTREHLAGFVSNLYTDLLINDRLQRDAGLNLSAVYQSLGGELRDPLWNLYMHIYELLWQLPPGSLTTGRIEAKTRGDAQLGARLIRAYARHWLDGAGRFAALCLPYLLEDDGLKIRAALAPLMDADRAGAGTDLPDGLAEIDPDESDGAVHPALDPILSGLNETAEDGEPSRSRGGREIRGGRKNQHRPPADYIDLMKSIGVRLTEDEIVAAYYREAALPHLVPFPARFAPESVDPTPEGTESWDIGSPLGEIDWFETAAAGPYIIPGATTRKRTFGDASGSDSERRPPDLFLGVDCSGSMPNPRCRLSFPVLAGSIVALSALRAGVRVKVVLSGEPGEFTGTREFTRSEADILKALTDYLGTGYAFGIQRLDDTFGPNAVDVGPTHILIITDGDIFSMLDETLDGWEIARLALAKAGSGTFVLHQVNLRSRPVERLRSDRWDVHGLDDWESLIEFARNFSRQNYDRSRFRQ